MPKLFNKVIKVLIISDFFLNFGWGFLSPIFAIFVLENIALKSPSMAVQIAGLSALFYWIPKSFFQIPVGIYLDKNPGEKDDFWFMVIGTLIVSLVPIGYIFSSQPWQIYLLQVVYAAGMAMELPSWLAIFTRHIDKGKEAFEWGLESTSIGTGAGVAGGLSGIFVSLFGFRPLFVFVSIFTVISALLLLIIKKNISSRQKDKQFVMISGGKPVIEP